MLFKRFFAVFEISRPINVLIAMLSILVAVIITGSVQPFYKVILACISGGIIMAGSNTINDYFDLDIDRVNRPGRPLVKGNITPQQAFIVSCLEFGVGCILAIWINLSAFVIALVVSGIIILYSYRLKRMPLLGNLAVSFSTAMAFVYGGVAVNRITETFVPAVLAFFFHLGREIIKDLQDREGDSIGLAHTFPLLYGEMAALKLTTAIFLLLGIILPLPFLFNWYNGIYLGVTIAGIYPVLFYVTYSMWKNRAPKNLGFLSNLLKVDMLVGLLAIYLG
ncbi:MAG: geranylgeranylglycerol-phosphate geranylgeranyltransferase [bacterium]|nr:MAG: geranylgeranylglycerol-phosphate geranylgeranyltransferase [bacterium]